MITVREFARLTTEPTNPSIDLATIPKSAFDWLVSQSFGDGEKSSRLVRLERPNVVKLANYVGVIRTACGTQIEILPKCSEDIADIASIRRLLVLMISEALQLTPRTGGVASIETFRVPLTEWVAAQFLISAMRLVKWGLRQQYLRVDERERFIRGRLDLPRQLRSGPGRAHLFDVQHDVFTFDRPENRLLRSAVDTVLTATAVARTWRTARELSILLAEVPASPDPRADFQRWARDKFMGHYEEVRLWCELILSGHMPVAIAGQTRGPSLLFPMEQLFEAYVAASLRRQLPAEFVIRTQARERHLVSYQGAGWFELQPDILVERGQQRWVIDAKWKRLNGDQGAKFGVDQDDIYQLFAYGQKYLGGVGDVFLVYPRSQEFASVRGPFEMSESLRLYLLPFDLDTRTTQLPNNSPLACSTLAA